MNLNKLDNQDCPIDEVNSEAEMVPDFSNIPFDFFAQRNKKASEGATGHRLDRDDVIGRLT